MYIEEEESRKAMVSAAVEIVGDANLSLTRQPQPDVEPIVGRDIVQA